MTDPARPKTGRLSELPREIAPPRDGWPALEAKLREYGMPRPDGTPEQPRRHTVWIGRRKTIRIAALAAALAAVVLGISIDRWILPSTRPTPAAAPSEAGVTSKKLAAGELSDPRYAHESAALLRSLDAQLATLPPPTRKKVLESLATIHQSMRTIQEALGREPGNALLQELLIDTYEDEMQVLSAVQKANGSSGET